MKKILSLFVLFYAMVAAAQPNWSSRPSNHELSPTQSIIFSGAGDSRDIINAGADDATPQASVCSGYVLVISIDPPQGGTTTPEAGSHFYLEGSVIDLTATPAADYEFINWSGAVADPSSQSTTVTMDSNKNVTAIFEYEAPQMVTLTISTEPADGGTTEPPVGSHSVRLDSVIVLVAAANDGYAFDKWSGDVMDATAPSTAVRMDASKAVIAHFKLADAVAQDVAAPSEYTLENYPNPFNSMTRIRYSLPTRVQISLQIIDVNGKVKRQLVYSEQQTGVHDVVWDGRDEGGVTVATGVYLCRLSSDGFQKTKKLLLVK